MLHYGRILIIGTAISGKIENLPFIIYEEDEIFMLLFKSFCSYLILTFLNLCL